MSREAPDTPVVSLDEMLTQASSGVLQRLLPVGPGMRFLAKASRQPTKVAGRVGALAAELGRVAIGTSEVAPARRDRRFADPAWMQNPLLRRTVQAYLASGQTINGIVKDVPMSWEDSERLNFAVTNVVEALAPSNNPFISPVAWKALIDSGGGNVIKGPVNLVKELSSSPRIPTMVDTDAYAVGTDLAITPGKVVLRTDVLELMQYLPQTETVHEVPLLIVPPTINKYYILDLAPGRSVVEYLVQQGQQVFVISWRNPDARHREWGIDEYAAAILESFDAVEQITGTSKAHIVAACSGGLLAALLSAHRAAVGKIDRLASLSLLVTMIDQSQAGLPSALINESVAHAAIARSARKGYLDGKQLSELFAWLRPNDLIWNYWVNNYIEGKRPAKFDILYWNADSTRMSAKLHRDFVEAGLGNKLAQPRGLTVLGTEVDLSMVKVDSYVVAGIADHICPWVNCYRSSQLLGGKTRFVLSTNGHIAALVNPPTNPKSSFRVADEVTAEPEAWLEEAEMIKGSWWPDYANWLAERSGKDVPAPTQMGSEDFPPIIDAPGTYVLAQ